MNPAQDLASDKHREELRLLEIENRAKARSDNELTVGTPTDEFKCKRCGKRDTIYTQKQTRSADEPMTLFIRCVPCGNKWRQY